MAAGEVLLDVAGVHQTLGGNKILRDLTFQVKDRVREGQVTGQVIALLGPSGVGKTRLLRLIAGLDAPDQGTIRGVGGALLPQGSVGYVFQNYLLFRHRTVLGNLVVAGRANGLSTADAKARSMQLLESFGLGDKADRYPPQLSGGQRQRVAIAQQLVAQKRLLLMDEPFSGLDPAALESTIRLLVKVAHEHEHTTLVLVTHDIRAAMTISDTLFMLGRDRDAKGAIVPGARVVDTIDMVERGLAWREEVWRDPKFTDLEREVEERFRTL